MIEMLPEAPYLAEDKVDYFSPADYFLGVVKHAVASNQNVRATLRGKGDISILPARNEYYANVPNMAEFCQAPASQIETKELNKDEVVHLSDTGMPRNIKDLLWQAAFHASQGRLVESRVNGESVHLYDVIQFHHWPNLTRLPKTQNTMRICALLTRTPSSIMLVHRKLGIEPGEVHQVYSAACSAGLVNKVSGHLAQAYIDDTNDGHEPVLEHSLFHSLFAKIKGL
ncbi:MAG TPA: hypothetical protein VIU46_11565 [Gallionellaceae bacterium]